MIWFSVDMYEMVECCPGFIGGVNTTAGCVLYTSGFIVSKSNTSSRLPLWECTDTTLMLRFIIYSTIFFKDVCPTMCWIV